MEFSVPAGSRMNPVSMPFVVVDARPRAVWWNHVSPSLVRSALLVPAWTRSAGGDAGQLSVVGPGLASTGGGAGGCGLVAGLVVRQARCGAVLGAELARVVVGVRRAARAGTFAAVAAGEVAGLVEAVEPRGLAGARPAGFKGVAEDGVDRTPRPVQPALGTEFVQDPVVEFGPYPDLGPLGEPAEPSQGHRARDRSRLLPLHVRLYAAPYFSSYADNTDRIGHHTPK